MTFDGRLATARKWTRSNPVPPFYRQSRIGASGSGTATMCRCCGLGVDGWVRVGLGSGYDGGGSGYEGPGHRRRGMTCAGPGALMVEARPGPVPGGPVPGGDRLPWPAWSRGRAGVVLIPDSISDSIAPASPVSRAVGGRRMMATTDASGRHPGAQYQYEPFGDPSGKVFVDEREQAPKPSGAGNRGRPARTRGRYPGLRNRCVRDLRAWRPPPR